MLEFLRKRGHRAAWPKGWSRQPQALERMWPYPKWRTFPPCWIEMRAATGEDIKRLATYQGRVEARYDRLSIVGKSSHLYTTERARFIAQRRRR